MSVVLLVRHGQASFGAADYDVLSPTGERQGELVGRALAARGVRPARVVSGGLTRHAQTAAIACGAAGWLDTVCVDVGWDEFDFEQVLTAQPRPGAGLAGHGLGRESANTTPKAPVVDDRAAFQQWFVAATNRWTAGEHDSDYSVPFGAFTAAVDGALERLVASLAPRDTAVVFTSGGPVSWVASRLLAGSRHDDPEPQGESWDSASRDAASRDSASRGRAVGLWMRLNPVAVNGAVTKVLAGRRGLTLVSMNDHGHVEPDHLTYR